MLILDASLTYLPDRGAYFRRAGTSTTTTTATEIKNGQDARRLSPWTTSDAAFIQDNVKVPEEEENLMES